MPGRHGPRISQPFRWWMRESPVGHDLRMVEGSLSVFYLCDGADRGAAAVANLEREADEGEAPPHHRFEVRQSLHVDHAELLTEEMNFELPVLRVAGVWGLDAEVANAPRVQPAHRVRGQSR